MGSCGAHRWTKVDCPRADGAAIIGGFAGTQYDQKHAVIVGVSVDSTGSHKEFCAKQGLTFKLLADTEKTVSGQYGSLTNILGYKIASRNTFLVNPEGRIAKVWTGVSPASHSSEVLAALAQFNR